MLGSQQWITTNSKYFNICTICFWRYIISNSAKLGLHIHIDHAKKARNKTRFTSFLIAQLAYLRQTSIFKNNLPFFLNNCHPCMWWKQLLQTNNKAPRLINSDFLWHSILSMVNKLCQLRVGLVPIWILQFIFPVHGWISVLKRPWNPQEAMIHRGQVLQSVSTGVPHKIRLQWVLVSNVHRLT
jgi:hypothetical protein